MDQRSDPETSQDHTSPFQRGIHQIARALGLPTNGATFPVRSLLSELTLDYPKLQWESAVSQDEDRWASIVSAHELIVLYSYLDDRMVDGQFQFIKDARLYVRDLLRQSMCLISDNFGSDGVRVLLETLERAYRAQVSRPKDGRQDPRDELRSVERFVTASRASLGFVVTECVALSKFLPEAKIRVAENSFKALVTGLQWADDLVDWRDDLATRDENLLLLTLTCNGRNAYSLPAGELRTANVAHALLEDGTIHYAADRARRWFDIALRKQERLDAERMIELIQLKRSQLDSSMERAIEEAAVDVLEQLIPEPTAT